MRRLLILLIFLQFVVLAYAAPPKTKVPVEISAVGVAPIGLEPKKIYTQRAKNDAFRYLTERIYGMMVTVERGKDAQTLRTKAEGYLKGARVVDEYERWGLYFVRASVKIEFDFYPPLPEAPFYEGIEGIKDFRELRDGVEINWTRGTIVSTATSDAENSDPEQVVAARRKAYLFSLEKSLAAITNINLDNEKKVGDTDTIRLQAFVRGSEVVDENFNEMQRVYSITTRLQIRGISGLQTLLLETIPSPGVPPTSPYAGLGDIRAYLHSGGPFQGLGFPVIELAALQEEEYDAILISVADYEREHPETPLETAVFPRIVDPEGNVLHSLDNVERPELMDRGVVTYTSAEGGLTASLPGLRLYVVKAALAKKKALKVKGLDTSGKNKVEVVISKEDYLRIKKDPKLSQMLAQAKVIIEKSAGIAEAMRPASRSYARPPL